MTVTPEDAQRLATELLAAKIVGDLDKVAGVLGAITDADPIHGDAYRMVSMYLASLVNVYGLPAGTYQFRAMAVGADGGPPTEGAQAGAALVAALANADHQGAASLWASLDPEEAGDALAFLLTVAADVAASFLRPPT